MLIQRTYSTWQLNDNGTWTLISADMCHYNGPVAYCKKNRKEKKELAKLQADLAKQQAASAAEAEGVQRTNRARSDALIAPYESLGLGELSPLAQAEMASENDEIRRVYGGILENAERAVGARGFGRAPSGFAQSAREGVARGKAEAETGAFRSALGRSEEGRRLALGYRTGQQQFYDPLNRRTGSSNIAGQAGESYGNIGSTFGDIMSGIGTLAPIAMSFLPGGQFAGSFSKLGKKAVSKVPTSVSSGIGTFG